MGINPLTRKAKPSAEQEAAKLYQQAIEVMAEVKTELEHICAGIYGGQDAQRNEIPGLLERLTTMETELESIKEAQRREDQNQEYIMSRLVRVLGEETPSKRGGAADGPTIPVR